jgi:hypothetical protein
MPTITKELRDKMEATRRANLDKWASQTIKIDNDWQILRDDELNWRIEYQGRFYGFYSNIPQCFKALTAKMLTEEARLDAKTVIDAQKAICEKIDKAFSVQIEDIR